MKDFVSNRWSRVVALAALMAIIRLVFILYGFPWTGPVWVSLAFSAALWSGTGSTRSIVQVVDDIEAEPVLAVATPVRVAMPVPKAVLRSKEEIRR
jgi:hypothetical protein